MKIIAKMTTYERRAYHCKSNSKRLSNMSYREPPVAGSLGSLFQGGKSSHPLPVPPPTTSVPAEDTPVPSLGTSSLNQEDSSQGSFKSAQQVVNSLVEIVEADLEMDDKDARILSDAMTAEVRSVCSNSVN